MNLIEQEEFLDNLGCASRFCYIHGTKRGMVTNGGCNCLTDLMHRAHSSDYDQRHLATLCLRHLLEKLHSRIADLELEKEKELKQWA